MFAKAHARTHADPTLAPMLAALGTWARSPDASWAGRNLHQRARAVLEQSGCDVAAERLGLEV